MMTTPASMLSSPQAEELSRLVARIRALAPSLPAGLLREAGTCVLSLAEGMEGLAQDSPVLPLRLAFTDQQAEPTEVGDAGSVGSLEGEEHLADEPGDDAAEAAERPRETATLFAPALIGGTEYEVPLEEVPPEDNYGLPQPGQNGSGTDGLDFGLPGVVAAAPMMKTLFRPPPIACVSPYIELRGVAGSDVCGFSTWWCSAGRSQQYMRYISSLSRIL